MMATWHVRVTSGVTSHWARAHGALTLRHAPPIVRRQRGNLARAQHVLTSPAARGRCGMSRIRTLVVEDQPIARDRLVELLHSEPDVEVVGAAETGLDAVDAIRRLSPDLVFLDLQIPDLDGFGVISEIGQAMPLTIFVTAYDEYALRAFDVHAFDYLLKPFGRERFQEALGRARARLAEGREEQLARRLVSLVQDVGGPKPMP